MSWARRAKAEHPNAKVFIGAENGRLEWTEVYQGNPNITHPTLIKAAGEKVFVSHYTGHRPYIKGTEDGCIVYDPAHRAEKGDLFLSQAERDWAARAIADAVGEVPFLLFEPHVKGTFAGNKSWIWDRWCEVSEKTSAPIIQVGNGYRPLLPKARLIKTKSIRQAFAIVGRAACVVVTDGALHHAAAALNVPAVVLWGARTNPDILGYPDQINLWTGTGVGCGAMNECAHCIDGMRKITPDIVLSAIEGVIG